MTGKVGLYDGDPNDPLSTRLLPLNNPASYLSQIHFHSDLDYLEVALAGTVTINHALVPGNPAPTPIGGSAIFADSWGWNAGGDDNLIVTHNLGYEPFVLVAAGNNVLWPGMPVDNNDVGSARYATAYVTTTELRLATICTAGVNDLPAKSITYTYLVFKNPPAAVGSILFKNDPSADVLSMGLGKFSSDRAYLQVVPGGSPLGVSLGRTIDLNKGAMRAYRSDGTHYEPVPADLAMALYRQSYDGTITYPVTYGASMAYGGSYAAPASLQVQAP